MKLIFTLLMLLIFAVIGCMMIKVLGGIIFDPVFMVVAAATILFYFMTAKH